MKEPTTDISFFASTAQHESFRRATVPQTSFPPPESQAYGGAPAHDYTASGVNCIACKTFHPIGACPLKLAGVEVCNLCGIAHFGAARVCPHIQSETQVRRHHPLCDCDACYEGSKSCMATWSEYF